jgi:hypothetical protein
MEGYKQDNLIPCDAGVERLHRSPARHRRRNGNPVPGGVTGPPCSSEMALQVGGVSNLRQYNVVMSSVRLGPENDYADEGQHLL